MGKLDSTLISELTQQARAIRRDVLKMITAAKSGHPGGSLSAVDILTVLYFVKMNIDPMNPHWLERDRFVLSKGHASPALYATLAARGYFNGDDLLGFRKINSRLQGHPDMKGIAGVDMSTGSLGQGLSAANGMALAGRIDNRTYRVFVLLGDGELEEGQVWEAAMFAAHYKLDNLAVLVDNNGLQIDGKVSEVMSPLPIPDKWRAFGWNVIEIDGHDFEEIYSALQISAETKGRPTAIIASTVKGKGVCSMENITDWHGKAPTVAECEQFLNELAD